MINWQKSSAEGSLSLIKGDQNDVTGKRNILKGSNNTTVPRHWSVIIIYNLNKKSESLLHEHYDLITVTNIRVNMAE